MGINTGFDNYFDFNIIFNLYNYSNYYLMNYLISYFNIISCIWSFSIF
jgi:hypothetical protein